MAEDHDRTGCSAIVLLLMAAWITAAVVLFKRATVEGACDYWRWAAVVVAMPLICFIIGHEVTKRIDRSRR